MDNDHQVSDYDRQLGSWTGLTEVLHTRQSVVRVMEPLVGVAETIIVQTYRHRELGDKIFLEHVGRGGIVTRLVLPDKVAAAINRQREQLSKMARRRAGKQRAEEDKAAGIVPGYMRPGAKKPTRGKRKAKRKRRS